MQVISDGTILVFYSSLFLNVGLVAFIVAGETDKKGVK